MLEPQQSFEHPVVMFAQAFATQLGGHLVLMGVIFVVVWRWASGRLRRRRIPTKKPTDRAQILCEVRNTAATVAVGTVTALVVSWLYARGHTKLTADASSIGVVGIVAGGVGFLLFNDLWFYAWHRLLHTRVLYRFVHVVHHRSVDVNPFTVYSFHPVEAFLLGVAVVPWVLVVPTWLPVLAVAQVVGLANNVMSHLGYELLPAFWARVFPFNVMNTATYHALHHAKLNGNYGLLLRVWDKLGRTELPGYDAVFTSLVTARDAPPPDC